MELLIARLCANALTFFVTWIYISGKMKKYNATNEVFNQKQAIENIKNGNRIDYAIGREENWRNTWNSRNPVVKKPTIKGIIIKGFLLYFFVGLLTELCFYIELGIFHK